MMKRYILLLGAGWIVSMGYAQSTVGERWPAGEQQRAGHASAGQFEPVDFADVHLRDSFWDPFIERLRTVTLQTCIRYTEEKTGRIRNFEKAAQRKGVHEGKYYDDSDVYKALEAIAYILHIYRDSALERKAEEWIDKIAAAQLPDGYINTYFTLTGLDKRWTDMEKHEDYCAGHLIEAGIAYFKATGRRKLLDVGIRMADNMDSTFRLRGRHWVTGHEEIELALVKLYRLTGQSSYLQLSRWLLEQRGHGYGRGSIWQDWKNPGYCQDAVPLEDQRTIGGHAVRAMYLYSGAADVTAATGDSSYWQTLTSVWEDVVDRNLYLTGGIGAEESNEGFGLPYHLPNAEAYCETCASVGMVFWNQRMNRLTGESKYVDILERSLYNAALDGISLGGDRFFYGNPLASAGKISRQEWFGTACCPSNISRLLASIGSYIYGVAPDGFWVNLFIQSAADVSIGGRRVTISQETRYPWKGDVRLLVEPQSDVDFDLHIRIPGWITEPVPGDLYAYSTATRGYLDKAVSDRPTLLVNGKPAAYRVEKGYAVLGRKWRKGDVVELQLPMRVRLVDGNPAIKADSGRSALQYGPLVYCVEGVDNPMLPGGPTLEGASGFSVRFEPGILGGVNVIRYSIRVGEKELPVTAIPYYAWCNRGETAMAVWLKTIE